MRVRSHLTAAACALLAALSGSGCKETSPLGLYCEGGVVEGRGGGGECMQISAPAAGAEAGSVGVAVWVSDFAGDRYSLHRVAKRKYELRVKGARAGSLDVDGTWITVVFSKDARTYHLRSDRPGLLT